MPIAFHVAGRPVPGAAVALLVVDPNYRKSALGLELLKTLYRDYRIVATLGVNSRVAKLYRLMGQYIADPMPRYVCVADECALAEMIRLGEGGAELTPDSYVRCGRLRRPESRDGGFEFVELTDELLPVWDSAWREAFAPRLQGVYKDSRYMEWRYLRHPVFKYDLFAARDGGGRIGGLACLRRVPLSENCSAVRVLEFLAADREAGLALAGEVARRVPPGAAFVEHIALGDSWLPLAGVGMSGEGANLFSTYFSPPDFRYNHIKAAFHVALPDTTPEAFIRDPATYITIADGDQDRPN